MSQQKIFIVALTLTLGLAGLFYGTTTAQGADFNPNNCATPKYRNNNKNQCAKVTPTPTPSPSPSPSPSVSPDPSATPAASPTVSPTPSYTATGPITYVFQKKWKSATQSTEVVNIGEDTPERAVSARRTTSGSEDGLIVKALKTFTFAGQVASIFSSEDDAKPAYCFADKSGSNVFEWNNYLAKANISINDGKGTIYGTNKGSIAQNYLISSTFTAASADRVDWKTMALIVQYPKQKSIQVYYRISDVSGTTDPNDKGWIQVTDPTIVASPCHSNNRKRATYKINQRGKYFQYKINMTAGANGNDNGKQNVEKVELSLQPLTTVATTPNPGSTTPTPTPTATNVGKITIVTRKLVVAKSTASPTPNGPALPNLTPSPSTPTPTPTKKASPTPTSTGTVLLSSASPSATTSPVAKPEVNPICFDDQDTDTAANVPVSLRQTAGGSAVIEDEVTDEDGLWRGLGGEVDEFTEGTYAISFKQFEGTDYKLVALCVTPDDGDHYLKTQTSPTGGKATIFVRPGQETKVTALYAPRNKPYISMNKFALDKNNRIVKTIVPGQSVNFMIRYENTGESDAKSVVIQDLIPEQFYVPASDKEFVDDPSTPFTTSIDAYGRTLITKKIDTLKKGQKGSITIPVVLRSDAFGSPNDISNAVQQQKDQAAQQSSQTAASPSPVSSNSASTNTSNGLQLQ